MCIFTVISQNVIHVASVFHYDDIAILESLEDDHQFENVPVRFLTMTSQHQDTLTNHRPAYNTLVTRPITDQLQSNASRQYGPTKTYITKHIIQV